MGMISLSADMGGRVWKDPLHSSTFFAIFRISCLVFRIRFIAVSIPTHDSFLLHVSKANCITYITPLLLVLFLHKHHRSRNVYSSSSISLYSFTIQPATSNDQAPFHTHTSMSSVSSHSSHSSHRSMNSDTPLHFLALTIILIIIISSYVLILNKSMNAACTVDGRQGVPGTGEGG